VTLLYYYIIGKNKEGFMADHFPVRTPHLVKNTPQMLNGEEVIDFFKAIRRPKDGNPRPELYTITLSDIHLDMLIQEYERTSWLREFSSENLNRCFTLHDRIKDLENRLLVSERNNR
jgi:hypothetical protein